MSCYTIEEYNYENGKYSDELLNKKVINLAKRNKFYIPQIKNVIDGSNRGLFHANWSQYFFVAKKKTKKDYKVVGFIIFYNHDFSNRRERFHTSLEYWLVDESWRGIGVGKKLYEKMLDAPSAFKSTNYKVMFKKDDENLINLYTKLGYSYIDKYDGNSQVCNGEHTIWWNISLSKFYIGNDDDNLVVLVE